MRVLADLNALGIFFVSDHPGHEYVRDALEPAFTGEDRLVLFGYQPLRLHWVLEDLGLSRREAGNHVCTLVQHPCDWIDADSQLVLDTYAIASAEGNDPYDCFYVALARRADVDRLLTTDRDFEALCADESFDYHNPVPDAVLERFDAVS
jgi:predicted nucleic acid-binding protein